MAHQTASGSPSGPGPLIWVVILLAAVAGAIWGVGTAVAVGVAVTALFVLIGLALEQSEKRKRAQRMPPLTDEMRGVFDRMLGRGLHQDAPGSGNAAPSSMHLPRNMVPPPGHHLKASVAASDMYTSIGATRDQADKAALLITRCFDNALHCDAREWGIVSAKDAASKIFGAILDQSRLNEMHAVAEEAVRLGYRTATPFDIEVMLGTKTDDSWRPELASLVARARSCAQADLYIGAARTSLQQVIDSLVKTLASAGHPQGTRVQDPVANDVLYDTVVPMALAWMCILRGRRDATFPLSAEFRGLHEEAAQTMVQSHARASQVLTAEWNRMMPPDMKRSLASAGIRTQIGGDESASRSRALESLQACITCVATSGRMKSATEAEINLGAWASERLKMQVADTVRVIRSLPT